MPYAYFGDIPKEEVLCALFNNAKPSEQGDNSPMTVEEAKKVLEEKKGYIGYHRGRELRLEFSSVGGNAKMVNTTEYDQAYYHRVIKKSGEEVIRDLRFGMGA